MKEKRRARRPPTIVQHSSSTVDLLSATKRKGRQWTRSTVLMSDVYDWRRESWMLSWVPCTISCWVLSSLSLPQGAPLGGLRPKKAENLLTRELYQRNPTSSSHFKERKAIILEVGTLGHILLTSSFPLFRSSALGLWPKKKRKEIILSRDGRRPLVQELSWL